jgi:hypothetical protein
MKNLNLPEVYIINSIEIKMIDAIDRGRHLKGDL